MAQIWGTENNDVLTGTSVNDIIFALGGNDVIDGGAGADGMQGGAGDDTYHADHVDDHVVEAAGAGFDKIYVTADSFRLFEAELEQVFYSGTGNFTFTGNGYGTYVRGGAGQDWFKSGAGADTMEGLGGGDTYQVDNVGDVIIEKLEDEGFDSVQTTLLTYTLAESLELLTYIGTGTAAFIGTGNSRFNAINGGDGDDMLNGMGGGDNMNGGKGNDTYYVDHQLDRIGENAAAGIDTVYVGVLNSYSMPTNVEVLRFLDVTVWHSAWGNDSDNTIEGGDMNDQLSGGAGVDTLIGRKGDDTYVVDNAADVVVELAGEGNDRIDVHTNAYVMPANTERMIYFGTPGVAFTGTGNALDNEINGGTGNDILIGGAGADKLGGGLGDDTYDIDNVGDTVFDGVDQGLDRINTSLLTYTLPTNIEQLVFNGAGNFTGTGNAANNYLKGGSGNDKLYGLGGADQMEGLAGDDIYFVGEEGDQVIEAANAGFDSVVTTLGIYTLGANVEALAYTGTGTSFLGNGNALNNTIQGSSGNDVLDGKEGADQLHGGTGDDLYFVDHLGDQIHEAAGNGWDIVYTTLSAYTLAPNTESLRFVGAAGAAFTGIGNGLDNLILTGSGNDRLDGGAGADRLTGGLGDDTYVIDNVGDQVEELAGEGFDTIETASFGSWTLAGSFERLVFTGFGDFAAYGNAANNDLVTNGGNDQLNGGAGADRMEGKGGNDIYFVDDAGDTIVEEANGGTDFVYASAVSFVMGVNVENLLYTGPLDRGFTVTGSAVNNMIETGEAADHIDGGAGADTMIGRGGNDVYVVDHLGDVVSEQVWGGSADEVRTAIGSRSDFTKMYVLADNVENLTGTSATGQGVYGNSLDNVIKMGAGADLVVLQHGGNDTVEGGGGDDFFYWADTFNGNDVANGGAGFDSVGLLGQYELKLGANSLIGIEKLAVYSSGGFIPNSYDITTVDANVAAGKNLMVVGLSLSANERLLFNGSAETNGSFNIRGGKGEDTLAAGAGNDQLYGNLGADILWGGAGKDHFEYAATAESNYMGQDRILDLALGDKINLWAIDADNNAANGNSKFSFIGAAQFSNVAGQLRAMQYGESWVVEADVNGDSIADLSILVTTAAGHIMGASDFIL